MKYALVNSQKKYAKDVLSGTIGKDIWFPDYKVKAHVGKYRQYWVYINGKPKLPPGYEPESEWHAAWKLCVEDQYCEVICGMNREHRADIKTSKYVIEIQKCSIDGWAVIERIDFYKILTGNRVIWVVNIADPWVKKRISTTLDRFSNDGRFIIKWSYAWKWVIEIAKNTSTHLFLDFKPSGSRLILMWHHDETLYGKWVTKVDFFNRYLRDAAKHDFVKEPNLFLKIFSK